MQLTLGGLLVLMKYVVKVKMLILCDAAIGFLGVSLKKLTTIYKDTYDVAHYNIVYFKKFYPKKLVKLVSFTPVSVGTVVYYCQ